MRGIVETKISTSLHKKLLEEKERLVRIESKKVRSRRRRITIIMASQNLAKRLR